MELQMGNGRWEMENEMGGNRGMVVPCMAEVRGITG